MPNIRDVAKLANVSIATVSRVINGSKNVSDETRKKVLRAINELGYKPTASFKDYNKGLLRTIGVMIPDIRGYHYGDILKAIEDHAYRRGFDIMVAFPKMDSKEEAHILDEYFRRKVDGVIIGELFGNENIIRRFELSGIPIVMVDFDIDELNFDVVNVNNIAGGFMAIKYLYQNGHRNVLYLPGPPNSPASVNREKGILKFIEHESSDVSVLFSEVRGYNSPDGYDGVRKHLKKHGLNFTAIFAVNDGVALGAIDCLREHGLDVPVDVSVIGFDDAPYAAFAHPRLTTIAQPREEMGLIAAQLLIERITRRTHRLPKTVTLPVKLVERNSVRSLKT